MADAGAGAYFELRCPHQTALNTQLMGRIDHKRRNEDHRRQVCASVGALGCSARRGVCDFNLRCCRSNNHACDAVVAENSAPRSSAGCLEGLGSVRARQTALKERVHGLAAWDGTATEGGRKRTGRHSSSESAAS
jgi:hypothetical protein